ncbi:hypothetical protein QCA50_016761 [Cerrena zonata]|uniref:Protein kinase domain-containing protein n=1 Tax=Cerrena zonata TaxID=2478898 RepID=A0AAW0FLR0_9APHY
MRAILFKKLIPITDTTVVDLVQPFLETVQCHASLRSIGIQHGDISDTNLMVDPESKKGVLVDFDLATVVDNDTFDIHPLHGNDRTGTMVFMALDLLGEKGLQGETPLRYRHDLESFCWVFLWICYCYDKGKRTIRYPFKDWINATPRSCRGAKFAVIGHLQDGGSKPFDSEYSEKSLRRVARYWLDFHNDMDTDFEEPGETETLHFVLGLLPRSQTVEMQWARTYTQVSPTACGSE